MKNLPLEQVKCNSDNAVFFKTLFSPLLQKYIQKYKYTDSDGKDWLSNWQTKDQPLTDSKINSAIAAKKIIGYFLAASTHCFGVDLDDHTGKGDGYLLSLYRQLCDKIATPSMLCRTEHGLHAFYFLSYFVPEILLIARVRHILTDTPIEVRPTAKLGMRIPEEMNLLNPRTLAALNLEFKDVANATQIYHPIEILSEEIIPTVIIEGIKERQAKLTRMQAWTRLNNVVTDYLTYGIHNGRTNDALNDLIPIYRTAGYTAEEAAAEFTALLSPDYTGELRNNYGRLLRRICSYYKNAPETQFNALPKIQETDLFVEQIADAVAALVTGPTHTRQQRSALTAKRRTAKKAVLYIERWKAYISAIVSGKQLLAVWDYLYPYFNKNTSEGLTPVSRNTWKKIHTDYNRWLKPFLNKIGYLTRSSYRYSKMYGICYYYRIDGLQFLQDTPQQPQAPQKKYRYEAERIRAEKIREYKKAHPDTTIQALGEMFEISTRTVLRALKNR